MTLTDDEKFLKECEAYVAKGPAVLENSIEWHEPFGKVDRLISMVRERDARVTQLEAACRVLDEGLEPFAKIAVDFIPIDEPFRRLIFKARAAREKAKELLNKEGE